MDRRRTAIWLLTAVALNGTLLAASPPAAPEVELRKLVEADWIEEDRRFTAKARGADPTGVTTAQDASGGCDGVKNGKWGFHTASGEQDPWWQVDLGKDQALDRVVVFNRLDGGTPPRTRHLRLLVSANATPDRFREVYQHDGTVFYGIEGGKPLVVPLREDGVAARIVRLEVPGQCSFALDEVEVYAVDDPQTNLALGKPADQKSVGPHSYPGTLGEPRPTGSAHGGYTLDHSREIVSRARALVARLLEPTPPGRLSESSASLDALEDRIRALGAQAQTDEAERQEIYFRARELLRAVAFANPLLDFDQILFVKRHDSRGVFHMCDQYYGFNAIAGGGLFVLVDPFGSDPRVVDILENAAVEKGRLEGRKLTSGSFLSPELSFDGRTIYFAYTEARGKDLEWTPESCHHVFRVQADGSGLVQLTDGPWDDFDPCVLPGGRIVFVSERRGGYLRCGRHCPTYALFSMRPDGSDVRWFSRHETHEWHPSVDNDGRVVYTRWDYVDRDTNVAHHIWSCFPDGRDPRSFHGNYPVRREGRPWMEMSIRAIPESRKYVATAAAHHGHAFGSLVRIDPSMPDDGAMSQLTRLTPDVPFPEAEQHLRPIPECMVYGTAWPLSEDDYLCVYGADAKNRGIYWIDSFGNRELLYRDPEISCLSPIPLRPRPRPPVLPDQTAETETIAVLNVYESDFQWPEGTRITALRIVQALPKTTPPPNEPRIGIANQTNARAVLGTVPVEKDGSAYFEAPVGKAIYFQALDERGVAIQSMRSATYVHAGERMTCLGCHESKERTPSVEQRRARALDRSPSKIAPEVEGSNPFSYVRLVQPVLDRNCVGCHEREKALDLGGTLEGPHGWSRSYANLAGKYGFYYHVSNGSMRDPLHGGSRTEPGAFGALAAPLGRYLGEQHYGLQLSDEDFRRIALWLDLNSEFYGSYDDTPAQARGEIVMPTLD